MLAMQYRFDLPEAFDRDLVRRRVAERGPSFDGLPGLVWKAFLLQDGARRAYAPLYLWRDAGSLRAFLESPAFAAVAAAFWRPAVDVWLVTRGAPAVALAGLDRLHLARPPAAPADEASALLQGYEPERWSGLSVHAEPTAASEAYELRYLAVGAA